MTTASILATIVLAILFASKMPQALFIPLAILLWTFRHAITKVAGRLSAAVSFIGSAWILGITIEIFAVWQNHPLPIGKRILFAQDPRHDIVIAVFFYLACVSIWYCLLRSYAFTPGQALSIQSIWSFVEQRGAVLKAAFAAGPTGVLLLLFVAGVYGTWIFFPVLVTQERFREQFPNRTTPRWYHFVLALFVLYLFIVGLALVGK